MEVLRFFKNKEWIPLYFKSIKARLRRDLNFADVHDAAEARKNLELTGDVIDHHHSEYDKKISDAYDNLNTKLDEQINISKEYTKQQCNDLSINLNKIQPTVESLNSRIGQTQFIFKDSKPKIDENSSIIVVWFCMLNGNEHIEVYQGGIWHQFGAFWK